MLVGHAWAFDRVQDRTSDGWPLRRLAVIDEWPRECLAIVVARRLTSDDVLKVLTDLFVERGRPSHIRPDNGGELTAQGGAHLVRADRRAGAVHRARPLLEEWAR